MIPIAEVIAARARIGPHLRRTPVTVDQALRLGFKWENQQVTGSFKPRGALNKVLLLSPAAIEAGLVASSAGNHGQAVAMAGRLRGARSTVYASDHASPLKLELMRALGAEVILVPGDYDAAEAAAMQSAAESGRVFISPYNDPQIMAGAGTLGLELLDQIHPRAVLIPTGGGGLLGGVGSVLKQASPHLRIIAVQNETSAYLHQEFHGGDMRAVVEKPSLADGLSGAPEVGSQTIPLMHEIADDFLLVTEDEIAEAIVYAIQTHGQIIEGSAAVGLAAVLAGKFVPDQETLAIVTGGNIDPARHRSLVDGKINRTS
jgi:threonine dehydratase